MLANKLSTYFPLRILLTIVFCLIILLVIFYFAIHQPQQKQNKLNQKISRTRSKIAEQKKYQSLYNDLQVRLKQFRINDQLYEIPELRKTSVSKKNIQEISYIIHKIADKAGLEIVSVDPKPQTLTKYESKLKINATFKGELANFKNLVLNLGSFDYVEQFTRIKTQDIVKNRKYNLRLWLNLN